MRGDPTTTATMLLYLDTRTHLSGSVHFEVAQKLSARCTIDEEGHDRKPRDHKHDFVPYDIVDVVRFLPCPPQTWGWW